MSFIIDEIEAFKASSLPIKPEVHGYSPCEPVRHSSDSSDDLDCLNHSHGDALLEPLPVATLHGGTKHCMPPSWIGTMVNSTFFGTCDEHRHLKKNECTYFCTQCAKQPCSLCQHCIAAHQGHQIVQIRRYVYCDVVRAADIAPFMDVSGVQCYIINQAKVVFLNHRPQAKMGKPSNSDVCRTCHRHLRDGFLFCSLACKLQDVQLNGGEPLPHLVMGRPGSSASDESCEEHEVGCYHNGDVDMDEAPVPKRRQVGVFGTKIHDRLGSSDSNSEDGFVLVTSHGSIKRKQNGRKQVSPRRAPFT